MKRVLPALGVAALIACSACGRREAAPPLPAGPDPAAAVAAAKEVEKRYLDAFNRADAGAALATYWKSPELVVYPSDVPEVRGWDAVRTYLETSFAAMPKGGRIHLSDQTYAPAGDSVVVAGKWHYTPPAGGGAAEEVAGRYTAVIAKRGAEWVYVLDHNSVAPAPQP